MERIKQAIENAKRPDSNVVILNTDTSHTKKLHVNVAPKMSLVKAISAFVLILLAGWLWLRLDFMNQLEQQASEYIYEGIKQAREEIKRRLADDAKYKQMLVANLNHCQEAAEKDMENYMKLAQNSVRVKNEKIPQNNNHEKFVLPQAAVNEAAGMLQAAKAECQKVYDTQLQYGK